MRLSIILLILVAMPVVSYSATIKVPSDYTTIQLAIDAAVNGDTVLVAPGAYVENIDFKGKAITVMSSNGAEKTIIDGSQNGNSIATFKTGEGLNSILDGFCVQNGSAGEGGGVFCDNASSPTIMNCVITANTANYNGGGICCKNMSSPMITECTITGNIVSLYYGGGVYSIVNSSPTIIGCAIMNNMAHSHGGGIYCDDATLLTVADCCINGNTITYGTGGGIACFSSTINVSNCNINSNTAYSHGGGIYVYNCNSTVINCTMIDNSAYYLAGGICCDTTSMTVVNSILRGSTSNSGPEIWIGAGTSSSTVTISYSNLEGGQSSVQADYGGALNWNAGMIDADPLFVDSGNGDYHLTFPSPCMNKGDSSAAIGSNDFEGDPRIAHATVDIGADEFYTHLYFTGDAIPGGTVSLKFIDIPGSSPVILWIGSGVLASPFQSKKYGYFYLQAPILAQITLTYIPTPKGVLSFTYTLDPKFPSIDIPMQALIGKKLTNLCVMAVK